MVAEHGPETARKMNTKLLELWGQTLLEAARAARGSEAFFDLFRNGYATRAEKASSAQKRFAELCTQAFGKEGIETFNTVMRDFYKNAGVVPRTQYNELKAEYEALKDKLREMEKTLDELRARLEAGGTTPSDVMDRWTDVARQYAEINQKFFDEFSKFFTVNHSNRDEE
jgi:predicted  nucleic acid-binding Zn-ribbon protein